MIMVEWLNANVLRMHMHTQSCLKNTTHSRNILESFTYEYDKNSNITKVTHINNMLSEAVNETRDYSYDQHGRLIQSVKTDKTDSSTVTTDYTYDDAGNRLTETVNGVMTEYTYNELNQLTGQVSDTSETLYLYDERGNQIHAETINEDESVSTVDMEYSVMGEMTSRTEKSGTNTTLAQTNVYDQDGQRIKRTQNETARTYYYDSGVVLYTKDGSTISSANILSDSGAAIGTYRGNTYHTYLKDAQGSTTNLVRSDGTLTAAYDYTDFGETTELAGASFDNQIRYTGGIYDEETGLYYLNARYYDPETGRFISQDSYRGEIDDPGQWHLYAYCANNPINHIDPTGHKKQFVGWGIQLEVAVNCGFTGIQYIWLNNKIKTRYGGKKFHVYTYWGGSFPTENSNKIRKHVKNNPSDLKTKDGLKKIRNVISKQASATVCILAIWANTKKTKTYKKLEGAFISFTLIGYHATFTFGLGETSTTAGFGLSTSKTGIAISSGVSTFRPKYTDWHRNKVSKISNYVKGKADDL